MTDTPRAPHVLHASGLAIGLVYYSPALPRRAVEHGRSAGEPDPLPARPDPQHDLHAHGGQRPAGRRGLRARAGHAAPDLRGQVRGRHRRRERGGHRAPDLDVRRAEREPEPALQREREVLHVRDRVGGPRAVRGRREQEGSECGACPFLRTFAAVG